MKRIRLFSSVLMAMLAAALCAGTAWSQGPPPPPASAPATSQQDAPGRVARLQYQKGQISMQPGGVNDWIPAPQNRPLTTADRIWADKNSSAELTLGTAALRINSETSMTFSNVSDRSVQLQLDQGVLSVTVFRLFNGEIYEVDTPNMAFTITKPGEYRFDVLPDADQTWVTVRKGQGQATGQGQALKINSGQQVRFSGGTSMAHATEQAPPRDPFEDWVKVRNQRMEGAVSARYVAPGVIGYEDLDTYGTWRTAPAYGPVWYPTTVSAGWAPYRYGHWVWIAPWGWTWVDDAPWGFAPFHYGRWVWWGGAWGWCPGPVVVGVRPVYAPALVAWYGGPRFGIGLSFGAVGVGWFPLGFGEPFIPWYHHGPGYFHNVNVTNTRITNVTINNYYNNPTQANNINYVNRNVNGAVTAAPNAAFLGSHSIARTGVAVPSSAMRDGSVMHGPQVSPDRASVLGGHTPLTSGIPSRTVTRPVVTRETPPSRPTFMGAGSQTIAHNNGGPSAATTPRSPEGTGPRVARPEGAQGSQQGNAAVNTAGNQPSRVVPRPPDRAASPSTPGTAGSPAAAGSPRSTNVPRPPERINSSRGWPNTNTMVSRGNVPRPPESGNGAISRSAETGSGSASRPATPNMPNTAGSTHPTGNSPNTAGPTHPTGNSTINSAPATRGNTGGGQTAQVPRPSTPRTDTRQGGSFGRGPTPDIQQQQRGTGTQQHSAPQASPGGGGRSGGRGAVSTPTPRGSGSNTGGHAASGGGHRG